MNKTLELLKLFEKFGVKPGKIIGAGDRNVVPIKKPILSKPLNRSYILEDVEEGKIGINTVKNEIEDIAPLFFQKQLNDVEINNLISNLNYLDRLLNPTNIVDIATKQPVKGLESLRPTIAGELKTAGKQLEEAGKQLEETKPNLGEIIKDFTQGQRAMQEAEKAGYVRATVREIMREDIKAGKLKLPKETEDQIMQGLGEPIDVWRRVYGEGALEQIDSIAEDLSKLRTEMDAAKLARSKFKFEPDIERLPGSYTPEEDPSKIKNIKLEMDKRKSIDDLIDEYNANQDKLLLTDEEGGTAIGYDEFRKLQERNKQIADALENKGISSKIEEEVKPEGIVIPFKKKITEPEEFADGGITRTKFAAGGRGKKILNIIKKANKELKGKKSMETFDLKTGEVIPTKEPIMTAESKSRKLTKDEIADYEEQLGDAETWLLEGTVKEAEEALKRSKAEEAYYRTQYKLGKLDPAPGEQTEARMKFLQKKLEEAQMTMDRRLITPKEVEELMELESRFIYKKGDDITEENFGSSPFAPSQETLDNLKKAREMTKGMSLQEEMNMILNQYDKSMFIKNEQGRVDVTNPENVRKMALLLKRDHPEFYRKLESQVQTNVLEDFDITGRKPNANGGLNYLMGF